MNLINYDFVKKNTLKREKTAHKGNFGRALMITGSYGMAGAAAISGEAAVKSGVGICHIFCPESIYPIVASSLHEAVYTPYGNTAAGDLLSALEKADCVAFGCGMGQSEATEEMLRLTVKNSTVPVIIDADGLNCLSRDLDIIRSANAPMILTPHLGEMSRLCGISVQEIAKNRPEIGQSFAKEHNVTLVLKGHETLVISQNGDIFTNTSGNAGMATGGSGDMLCGIMAALICRMPYLSAVCSAVYIHGAAGDIAADMYSEASTCPSLMMKTLPMVFKKLETD